MTPGVPYIRGGWRARPWWFPAPWFRALARWMVPVVPLEPREIGTMHGSAVEQR